LAEAFWMMEGYFVRTLGMHRVYNSAFMNMLKNEDNAKYRATIKNTLEFDPEILKRFVNFMNNPDEETAAAQFGKGDKYFGICTLLVTMPGLPMFGHGQIEGFEEKYGMEYRRSYRDEQPDRYLVERHERDIFPLMKKRALFSGSEDFCLYDFFNASGQVNENVFAYSNQAWGERALVFYNNAYEEASGWISAGAVSIPRKDGSFRRDSLCQALGFHGESRYFAVFREQRSNRWFVRSSKDIAERGLFVSLRGYETQVFLDIHEVEDDQWGRWARLNHELNGRGVWDLRASMEDLILGELYYRFSGLFTQEIIGDLAGILAAAPSAPEPDSFIGSLGTPVLAFVSGAKKYLDGAGVHDPFTTAWDHPVVEPEFIGEEFFSLLRRLIRLVKYAAKAPPGLTEPAGRLVRTWFAASPKLGESDAVYRQAAAFAVGYGILTLLRSIIGGGASGAEARALADHWALGRKLREIYAALGIPEDLSCRITEIFRLVLGRTVPEKAGIYGSPDLPESFILENYSADDFRSVLGVNYFEDVTWFNKEAYELALRYIPFVLALEAPEAAKAVKRPPKKDASGAAGTGSASSAKTAGAAETEAAWQLRLGVIARLTERFAQAEARSGYRLDRLIDCLPEKKSASGARKKSTPGSK
jgi:hypothetical protein